MFALMYRVGFTPWEGHALPARLVAAADRLPRGRALDVGCGTGDTAIFLAKAGWYVTAVDFVQPAIDRARRKAWAADVAVRLVLADVTRLRESGIQTRFDLIADNGCLHGLSDEGREALARELGQAAVPGATLVIAACGVSKRRGPRGIDREEIERRFGAEWEVLDGGIDPAVSNDPADPIHVYELRRREPAGSAAPLA